MIILQEFFILQIVKIFKKEKMRKNLLRNILNLMNKESLTLFLYNYYLLFIIEFDFDF